MFVIILEKVVVIYWGDYFYNDVVFVCFKMLLFLEWIVVF